MASAEEGPSLFDDLRGLSFRAHLGYWIGPLLFMGTSMALYFSGVPALTAIVCPPENREWGSLENTQLVFLLGLLAVSLRLARSQRSALPRLGFGAIALLSVLVFLEEIDYGAHFVELFSGKRVSALQELTGVYNLHSQGISDRIYKRSVYGVMALLFLIGPYSRWMLRHPVLGPLVPSPRISIVALIAIVSDLLPRAIVGFGLRSDGGLGKNIGEFSEVMVYYIFLVYLVQLSRREEWSVARATGRA